MSTVTLTLGEALALVAVTATLTATDAASLSRLGVALLAKRAGLTPRDILGYGGAVDGEHVDSDARSDARKRGHRGR